MARRGSLGFQGCHLAWQVDGEGPPLVIIQGVGACGTSPNPQTELLSARYSCLGFDNRGIGMSQPPAGALTLEKLAADVGALMDNLGWQSAHIVAHSFGGLIALQLALNNRSRVRSLTLLCSFARGMDASRLSFDLVWILTRLRFGSRAMRRKAFMELVLPAGHPEMHTDAMAKRLSGIVGHDLADAPPIVSRQIGLMRKSDLTARLGEIAGIPTLVVNGGKDRIARPALGRALSAGIPGARYVEIPGAGHTLPVIDPERCAALVFEHLSGLDG
ncbi:MAG TPA: alpha/beta fold hydrolase [Bryobacteraceae bacterium]|nr:alpha/beta fold hydrolase [Bryobacteraceae bacterium]